MTGGLERLTDEFRCQRSQRLGFPLPFFPGFPLPVETRGGNGDAWWSHLTPHGQQLMSGLQRFFRESRGPKARNWGCEKVST